ncbi:unnamed protein product [Phytophthora fragariaefolia]|uniref:Unnamed protein product n=1 Tax=Phytophthora fragariaefolia TaxID=1490495 RepID=A0A9W6XU59_9STRA|nr:unnamed protein product [Phytophthora fragariaefolia]
MSRPTLLGGRDEFLLQYPARLEPPTERDIARHRFTVQHGKKRRSFQAPDAVTFKTWLAAIDQALGPKKDEEQLLAPPSSTTSTATTAASSQMSAPGSTGADLSSRSRASTVGSNVSSQRSHASTARAPPMRLTLERPCFTRDPKNFKLLWLHRPAWMFPSAAHSDEADCSELDLGAKKELESETEVDYDTDDVELAIQTVSDAEDTQSENNGLASDESALDGSSTELLVDDIVDGFAGDGTLNSSMSVEDVFKDSEQESGSDSGEFVASAAISTSPVNASKFEELADMVTLRKADSSNTVENAAFVSTVVDKPIGAGNSLELLRPRSTSNDAEHIDSEVNAVVAALVSAVLDQNDADTAFYNDLVSVNDDHTDPESTTSSTVETIPQAVMESDVKHEDFDGVEPIASPSSSETEESESEVGIAIESRATAVVQETEDNSQMCNVEPVPASSASRSLKQRSVVQNSKRFATLASGNKWVPLDPTNSRLIWVRSSAEAGGKSVPRSSPRRSGSMSSRKWIAVDPSSTRLMWTRRVEAATRVASRYKAATNTRTWVPLEPDSSRYIWIRPQLSPLGETFADTSSSRL